VEIAIDEQTEVQCSYVVGLPHPDRGQDVVAAVILHSGQHLDTATLRQRLKQELSSYKVPGKIFFCAKNDIPFTDSGKVDKRRLIAFLSGIEAR
jgi:acyl-CoA synthetase (AMP-forming)/AMP-acid ligase II